MSWYLASSWLIILLSVLLGLLLGFLIWRLPWKKKYVTESEALTRISGEHSRALTTKNAEIDRLRQQLQAAGGARTNAPAKGGAKDVTASVAAKAGPGKRPSNPRPTRDLTADDEASTVTGPIVLEGTSATGAASVAGASMPAGRRGPAGRAGAAPSKQVPAKGNQGRSGQPDPTHRDLPAETGPARGAAGDAAAAAVGREPVPPTNPMNNPLGLRTEGEASAERPTGPRTLGQLQPTTKPGTSTFSTNPKTASSPPSQAEREARAAAARQAESKAAPQAKAATDPAKATTSNAKVAPAANAPTAGAPASGAPKTAAASSAGVTPANRAAGAAGAAPANRAAAAPAAATGATTAQPNRTIGAPVTSRTTNSPQGASSASAASVNSGGATSSEHDDLERVEGVGPRIATALREAGINSYTELAGCDVARLQAALESAGLRFAPSLPTWSRQAALLAAGDEEGFLRLTTELVGGRDVRRRG